MSQDIENDAPAKPAPAPTPLLSWLRLCRAPNVFTALADVGMGFLVVRRAMDEIGVFACLAGASACLYTAGMVLNDVFDIEVDRQERPFRPLPSGQIGIGTARVFGFGLLLVGVLLGVAAGYASLTQESVAIPWRSGLIAVLLAASVLFYDGFLKKTPFGPLGMGLCRFFNVLLGMSVGQFAEGQSWLLHFQPAELLPAAGIGLYIVGVTWFAKGEAGRSQILNLLGGMAVMGVGIALIGWWGSLLRAQQPNFGGNATFAFWLLLSVMFLVGQRRCLEAVLNPEPQFVQAAIKQCIFSLILFDAAVTTFGTGRVEFGVGIALLLAPTMLLGRWVYST
ncbi:MAG: UbiA family prenyltransferase [Planctomycetales bacterium]|nr:UbiA family prenyltransferase [Planctomycetales bacterium]